MPADAGLALRFQLQRDGFHLDVDLQLPGQGISAIFGRSGSGKTTLLRCIAGLESAARGSLRLAGRDYHSDRLFVPAHRRHFGYVFQEPSLFAHLDVRANLDFGQRRRSTTQPALDFNTVVEMMQLGELLTRHPQTLSGGQQQRVAIGRALLSQPDLLLLDEPLSGLDLESRDEILPFLERLHAQLSMPVLYVSHTPAEVQRLADHLVILDHGKVLASGASNALLTRPDLPLSHFEDAGAVLIAEVVDHDDHWHLSRLRTDGGELTVSRLQATPGTQVRVRVLARDVSIALSQHDHSSISNGLDSIVLSIGPDRDPAQALLQLSVGDAVILARITRRSVERLALTPGARVLAQIKSVALM